MLADILTTLGDLCLCLLLFWAGSGAMVGWYMAFSTEDIP